MNSAVNLPSMDVGSYAPIDWNDLDLLDDPLGLDSLFADPPAADLFSTLFPHDEMQPFGT